MKISPILPFFGINHGKETGQKLPYVTVPVFNKNLPYDTVSFGGNTSRSLDLGEVYLELLEREEKSNEEMFPMGIKPFIEDALKTMPTESLQNVHRMYFEKFKKYKTLAELRENCPEFKDIKLPSEETWVYSHFLKNTIPLLSNEEMDAYVLEMIKYMYCEGYGTSQAEKHFADGVKLGDKSIKAKLYRNSLKDLFDRLNIPLMNNSYTRRLELSDREYNAEHAKKLSKGQKRYLNGILSPDHDPYAKREKKPAGYRSERKHDNDAITLRKTYKKLLAYEKDKGRELIPHSVRVRLEKAVNSGEEITLEKIHSEVYAPLEGMTTIDEVREKFPEFKSLISYDEITEKFEEAQNLLKTKGVKYGSHAFAGLNLLRRINSRDIDFGVKTPDEFTILLLKMYHRDSIAIEDIFSLLSEMSGEAVAYNSRLFDMLNIPRNERMYAINLKYSNKDAYLKIASTFTSFEGMSKEYFENPAQIYNMTDYETSFWNANPERKEALMQILEVAYFSDDKLIDEINIWLEDQGADFELDENNIDPTVFTKEQRGLLQKYWTDNESSAKEFSEKLKSAAKIYGKPIKNDRMPCSENAQARSRKAMQATPDFQEQIEARRLAIAEARAWRHERAEAVNKAIAQRTARGEEIRQAAAKRVEDAIARGEACPLYLPVGTRGKIGELILTRDYFEKYEKSKGIEILPESLKVALDKAIDEKRDISFEQLNKEVYAPLLKMTTIDEVREKFPEFRDAKSIKEIDVPVGQSTLARVEKSSSIEEHNIDIFSILILKLYYYDSLSLKEISRCFNQVFNYNFPSRFSHVTNPLGIPMKDIIYANLLGNKIRNIGANYVDQTIRTISETNESTKARAKAAPVPEKATEPDPENPIINAAKKVLDEKARQADPLPQKIAEAVEKHYSAPLGYYPEVRADTSLYDDHAELLEYKKSPQRYGRAIPSYLEKDIEEHLGSNKNLLYIHNKHFEYLKDPNITLPDLKNHEAFKDIITPGEIGLERIGAYNSLWGMQKEGGITTEDMDNLALRMIKYFYLNAPTPKEAVEYFKPIVPDVTEHAISYLFNRMNIPLVSPTYFERLRGYMEPDINRRPSERAKYPFPDIKPPQKDTYIALLKVLQYFEDIEKGENKIVITGRIRNELKKAILNKENISFFEVNKRAYGFLDKVENIDQLRQFEEFKTVKKFSEMELTSKSILSKFKKGGVPEYADNPDDFILDVVKMYYLQGMLNEDICDLAGKLAGMKWPSRSVVYRLGIPKRSHAYSHALFSTTEGYEERLKEATQRRNITLQRNRASKMQIAAPEIEIETAEKKPPETTEEPPAVKSKNTKKTVVKMPANKKFIKANLGPGLLETLARVEQYGTIEEIFPYSLREELKKYSSELMPEPTNEIKALKFRDVTKAHYADLMTMESLKEVKVKYPEFRDVKSISDIKVKGSFPVKLARGMLPRFEGDKFVIAMLALYYHDNLTPNDIAEFLFELSSIRTKEPFKWLNIPIKHRVYALNSKCLANSKTRDVNFDKENTMQTKMLERIKEARETKSDELVTQVEDKLLRSYIENPSKIYAMSENELEYWSNYNAGRSRLLKFLEVAYYCNNHEQIRKVNSYLKLMEAGFMLSKNKFNPTKMSRWEKNWLKKYWSRSENKETFSGYLEFALEDYNERLKQARIDFEKRLAQKAKEAEEARQAQEALAKLKADIAVAKQEFSSERPIKSKIFTQVLTKIMDTFAKNPRLIFDMPDECKDFWQDNPCQPLFIKTLQDTWAVSYGVRYNVRDRLAVNKVQVKPEDVNPFGVLEQAKGVILEHFSANRYDERDFASKFEKTWQDNFKEYLKNEEIEAFINIAKAGLTAQPGEDNFRAVYRQAPHKYTSAIPTSFYSDIEKYAKSKNLSADFTSASAKKAPGRFFFNDETTEKLAREWLSKDKYIAIIKANTKALIQLADVMNKLEDREIEGYGSVRLWLDMSNEINLISTKMREYIEAIKRKNEKMTVSGTLKHQVPLINELITMGTSSDGSQYEKTVIFILNIFDRLREEALKSNS